MDSKESLTITEAARYLGVNRKVIYRLLRDKKLRRGRDPILVGGPEKIPIADLEKVRAVRDNRPPYGA